MYPKWVWQCKADCASSAVHRCSQPPLPPQVVSEKLDYFLAKIPDTCNAYKSSRKGPFSCYKHLGKSNSDIRAGGLEQVNTHHPSRILLYGSSVE